MKSDTTGASGDKEIPAALHPVEIRLSKGNHFRLRADTAVAFVAVHGLAWVTLDGDAGETIVSPGETFVVAAGKTALIGPLYDTIALSMAFAGDTRVQETRRAPLAGRGHFLRRLIPA